MGDSLEPVHRALRAGRIDEAVVTRFFKRRTVGWRVLLEPHLSGRVLAIGDHNEVLPLALAESAEEVWVAGVDPGSLAAVSAVASSAGTTVRPVHATIEELPFPVGAFDLIVVRCGADELPRYLAAAVELLAPGGRLAVVVDGWTRELGLAGVLGMAPPEESGLGARLASASRSAPAITGRRIEGRGLAVERTVALLSRGHHENELAFDAGSDGALSWLLEEFDATAGADEYGALRRLVRLARRSGLLAQCYPRYLHVCGRPPVADGADDAVVLAGKNRTTVLELADGRLVHLRKVANGRRHARFNEAADRATAAATRVDDVADAISDARRRTTIFGPERVERPVRGTPLDQLLDDRPARFARCLDVALTWLERLQTGTAAGTVRKEPSDVAADLADERFGLSDPPAIGGAVELPRVLVHGDYFGSNIYVADAKGTVEASDPPDASGTADTSGTAGATGTIDTSGTVGTTGTAGAYESEDWRVTGVIDWEGAELRGNPVVDAGFLALELATAVHDGDFERGVRRAFVEDTPLSARLHDRVDDYCTRVGIAPAAFLAYLPMGYLRIARQDVRYQGRLDVDWPARIETVWDHHDALAARLGVAPVERPSD